MKKGYCTDTQGVIAKRDYISLVRKNTSLFERYQQH
jgi:hypothetical protein